MKTLSCFLNGNLAEKYLVMALRLSLAVIFIWFGLLKVSGHNLVYELVNSSMFPFLATGKGFLFLGLFEAILGFLLLLNFYPRLANVLVFIHLVGTLSTFIFGYSVMFDPDFPVLSLEGEFVVKNLTLAISALVIVVQDFKSKNLKN